MPYIEHSMIKTSYSLYFTNINRQKEPGRPDIDKVDQTLDWVDLAGLPNAL